VSGQPHQDVTATDRQDPAGIGPGAEFTIGRQVTCRDGAAGRLRRVVIDPVRRVVTHLVVEPDNRPGASHLVPVELVDASTDDLTLQCTVAELDALQDAEETQFLAGADGSWGYQREQMLFLPYYGLGGGALGMGALGDAGPTAISVDRVPFGEIEVRRGDHVHASDGDIGRVQGLVVDPTDFRVTHVLLDEGHLWGRKRVAIPFAAVTGVQDGVRLNLSKDQVRDLPPVDLQGDGGAT
jgi:sporulation protein YlmC with PRC-barrel domain